MLNQGLPALAIAVLANIGCSPSPSSASLATDASTDAATSCGFLCNGDGVGPEDLDASLARRVQTRLALCNGQEGCHVSGAGELSYPAGQEFAQLINVRATERPEMFRVKPGDPSASYLYLKVLGDGGIEGGRMPANATYDPKIPATVFAWIEAGAPLP